MKKQGLGLVHHAGKEMAWGIGAKAGNFVFLSGAEARSEETDEPVEGILAQTRLALSRIKERLEEAGASMDNAVSFKWYVKDRKMIPDFYVGRDGWLAENFPRLLEERSYASTLLVVELALDEMLVEIDCIACIPDEDD